MTGDAGLCWGSCLSHGGKQDRQQREWRRASVPVLEETPRLMSEAAKEG